MTSGAAIRGVSILVASFRSQDTYSAQISRNRLRLEEIEFEWSVSGAEWRKRILPALKAFHSHYGHCQVPAKFVIPSNDEWPEESHGVRLWSVLDGIRPTLILLPGRAIH